MGETEKALTVKRAERTVLTLSNPYLAGVAFSEDFAAMVTRGDARETWYDTITGGVTGRPGDHAIEREVLLLNLLPEARDVKHHDTAVERFLFEVVWARRHGVVHSWDDERRVGLVKELLARTPGKYSSDVELVGLLALLTSWRGPVADKTAEEVLAAMATWPASHRKLPHWFDGLDWRVAHPLWRIFGSLAIRIEGAAALDEVRVLARADYLPRVGTLTVTGAIGSEGAALLAGWPGLAGVTTLQLRECGLGDAGAVALAASPYLGKLHLLEVSRSEVGDAGAVALSNAVRIVKGGELNLFGNCIGDEGALAIAALAGRTRPLRHLNLAGNRIGVQGTQALQQAGYRAPEVARGGPVVLLHDQRGA
jgi:hypothetical protein